ncbi:ribonuclease YeeF family protein [Priestia sp. TRN 1309]|uniref:ribonuclease YeeF family protein n=1 Tax=Priestia TaxID=2800373 RepID=UPI0013F5EE14|nr:T7SS effector LXG polymorphic toxin [Priestia aryabhattai]MED3887582.1 T7SS effector LXG polymorphic toxin [Priestia aryabhattai]MED4260106.1 T7SS effector LXG polymorphic toxin [Priestia aryabhattai]NHH92896.1 putative ribonuclease YwqJ [Bacillus sp. MB95]
MGKVYDAKALFDVAKDREKAYDELLSQLGELKKALQGVADLDGSLEGKGADNIKSFYKQHADTAGQWENLIKMQQSYFSTLHVKAEKAKLSGSTIVTESFLETELKNANSNAKEMVAQQHDDLQSILNGIDDIVSISAFSTSEFNDKIEEAEKKRTDTIEAVNQLDAEWSKEYSEMDDFYAVVDTLVSGLELATSQGGSVYQLAFDEKAYHDSELYKVQTKLNDYATSYVDYNKQQEEVYELEKKQEEEANKPWYEKTWDAVSTFTGEVSGYYDYKRAAEGVDPVTGEKLSTSQRVAAGAMAAAGFIPVVGWVGRAAKGGKAIYKTAKGLSAADHALDAYKSAKSFKVLEQTEKGLYGLVAANGLGEYMTGRDMFGNKISEEQRKASLLQALGIAGAGALSTKVAGKMGQSLATKGTEKLNNMRNTLRTSAVANVTKQAYQSVKNAPASWTQSLHKTYNNILDSSMPRLMPDLVPVGPALAQQTVRETLQNVKQQTMQMIEKPVKVERVSERQIQKGTKGTGKGSNTNPNKIKLTPEREIYYRKKIDEAEARGEYDVADDIRYDRYCEETKKPLDREKWDVRNENLKKITERGREEEIKGRKALGEHLDRKLENNNVGEVVTYTSSEGHLTRPDSIGRNSKGEIDLVHDHKHKISDKEHVIHNDSQMRAERELAQGKNGRHVVTISSDKPDLNGIPPKPRPSGPLAKESDIFYTDPSSGRVTHKWEYHPDIPGGGIWIKI